MEQSASSTRKWLAACFLGAAIVMLILGLTLFDSQLRGQRFIFYWLTCLMLTAAAGVASTLDLLAIRRQSIREQHDLVEDTIDQLKRDRKKNG